MKSKCENCGWKGETAITFPNIPTLLQRIVPGSLVPSGECPKCHALCYLTSGSLNNRPPKSARADPKPLPLFNGVRLALRLGVSRSYVGAMKRAGFVFSHGRRSTAKAALVWLQEHPDFVFGDSYPRRSRSKKEPTLAA